jgi:hypothetical protein
MQSVETPNLTKSTHIFRTDENNSSHQKGYKVEPFGITLCKRNCHSIIPIVFNLFVPSSFLPLNNSGCTLTAGEEKFVHLFQPFYSTTLRESTGEPMVLYPVIDQKKQTITTLFQSGHKCIDGPGKPGFGQAVLNL